MTAVGAVFGSATGYARRLRELDTVLRTPLPRCHRIGFVQLTPGVGATTAAAAVVTALAGRRVLAVDAAPSPRGLLALLDGPGLDLRPGPVPVGAWAAAVEPAARRHEVVVTDWGLRPAYELAALAGAGHALCLVVRAGDPVPPLPGPVVVAVTGARRVRAPAVPARSAPALAAALLTVHSGGRRDR